MLSLFLLLCVYARVVGQCLLTTMIVLYHLCLNKYILTIALLSCSLKAAHWYWHGNRQGAELLVDMSGETHGLEMTQT